MKYAKQLRISRGPTALRLKMGMTQQVFAQWLGISKSLVSMVENGNRSLPAAAAIKLAELEIAWTQEQREALMTAPVTQLPETPQEQERRTKRLDICRLDTLLLTYRLKRMKERYTGITEALRMLDCARKLRFKYASSSPIQEKAVELGREELYAKARRVDLHAQARLSGRIALLEIVIAAGETKTPAREVAALTCHLTAKRRLRA